MDVKEIIKEVSKKLRVTIAATILAMKAKNKINTDKVNSIADKTEVLSKEIIDKIESMGLGSTEESAFAVLSVANVLVDTVEIYLADNKVNIDIEVEEGNELTPRPTPDSMYL